MGYPWTVTCVTNEAERLDVGGSLINNNQANRIETIRLLFDRGDRSFFATVFAKMTEPNKSIPSLLQ
jgi:hypothetical protein